MVWPRWDSTDAGWGCAPKKGKAICKPWTFATNMQSVVDAFSAMRCARDHQHAVCAGEELRRTESHTAEMCDLLHQRMSAFVQNPALVTAAAAVPVEGDKVQTKQDAKHGSNHKGGVHAAGKNANPLADKVRHEGDVHVAGKRDRSLKSRDKCAGGLHAAGESATPHAACDTSAGGVHAAGGNATGSSSEPSGGRAAPRKTGAAVPKTTSAVAYSKADGTLGDYLDGVPQSLCCAASDGSVNCFHASESFIMDTGCGKGLAAQRHVAHLQRHVYVKDPFTFNTANGGPTTSERVLLSVEPLATTSEPYIMDSTPCLLYTSDAADE